MSDRSLWLTDDCCPSCGSLLLAHTHPDGSLIQECGCGWAATWTCGDPDARDAEHRGWRHQ